MLPRPAETRVEQVAGIEDDRTDIAAGEPTLLVVEDDPRYAAVLRDHASEHGFKVLVAQSGAEALRLVREYKPNAITLEILLPDMLGWPVLARLKEVSSKSHIQVQGVRAEEERTYSTGRGALS